MCVPPDGSPRPADTRTNLACNPSVFYIWDQKFTYDNTGTVFHLPSGITGTLQLVKSAKLKPPRRAFDKRRYNNVSAASYPA